MRFATSSASSSSARRSSSTSTSASTSTSTSTVMTILSVRALNVLVLMLLAYRMVTSTLTADAFVPISIFSKIESRRSVSSNLLVPVQQQPNSYFPISTQNHNNKNSIMRRSPLFSLVQKQEEGRLHTLQQFRIRLALLFLKLQKKLLLLFTTLVFAVGVFTAAPLPAQASSPSAATVFMSRTTASRTAATPSARTASRQRVVVVPGKTKIKSQQKQAKQVAQKKQQQQQRKKLHQKSTKAKSSSTSSLSPSVSLLASTQHWIRTGHTLLQMASASLVITAATAVGSKKLAATARHKLQQQIWNQSEKEFGDHAYNVDDKVEYVVSDESEEYPANHDYYDDHNYDDVCENNECLYDHDDHVHDGTYVEDYEHDKYLEEKESKVEEEVMDHTTDHNTVAPPPPNVVLGLRRQAKNNNVNDTNSNDGDGTTLPNSSKKEPEATTITGGFLFPKLPKIHKEPEKVAMSSSTPPTTTSDAHVDEILSTTTPDAAATTAASTPADFLLPKLPNFRKDPAKETLSSSDTPSTSTPFTSDCSSNNDIKDNTDVSDAPTTASTSPSPFPKKHEKDQRPVSYAYSKKDLDDLQHKWDEDYADALVKESKTKRIKLQAKQIEEQELDPIERRDTDAPQSKGDNDIDNDGEDVDVLPADHPLADAIKSFQTEEPTEEPPLQLNDVYSAPSDEAEEQPKQPQERDAKNGFRMIFNDRKVTPRDVFGQNPVIRTGADTESQKRAARYMMWKGVAGATRQQDKRKVVRDVHDYDYNGVDTHHGIDGMMSTPSRPAPATTPGQQLRRAASATPATRGGVMSVSSKTSVSMAANKKNPVRASATTVRAATGGGPTINTGADESSQKFALNYMMNKWTAKQQQTALQPQQQQSRRTGLIQIGGQLGGSDNGRRVGP